MEEGRVDVLESGWKTMHLVLAMLIMRPHFSAVFWSLVRRSVSPALDLDTRAASSAYKRSVMERVRT
jgi:phage baseplate assembly protein W